MKWKTLTEQFKQDFEEKVVRSSAKGAEKPKQA
jgi:hypothetical protein